MLPRLRIVFFYIRHVIKFLLELEQFIRGSKLSRDISEKLLRKVSLCTAYTWDYTYWDKRSKWSYTNLASKALWKSLKKISRLKRGKFFIRRKIFVHHNWVLLTDSTKIACLSFWSQSIITGKICTRFVCLKLLVVIQKKSTKKSLYYRVLRPIVWCDSQQNCLAAGTSQTHLHLFRRAF